MIGLRWHLRAPVTCMRCGHVVRRRWWHHGLLRPLPLCSWTDLAACDRRAG